MFTVKQVTLAGYEFLWETPCVNLRPAFEQRTSDRPPALPAAVCLHGPDGPIDITGGTVFVMNEAGATVSRWDLGASPVRLSAKAHTPQNDTAPDSAPQ